MLRLFFQGKDLSVLVEFSHAVSFRITDILTEDGSSSFVFPGLFQDLGEIVSMEQVISQYQTDIVITDEFFAQDKGLSQSVRAWLDLVG